MAVLDYGNTSVYFTQRGSLISKELPKDGNGTYTVTVAPAVEPITAEEVKTFARIGYSEEDALIESFITAARVAAEEYTGLSFIERTIQLRMDYWPGTVLELSGPPLLSVDEVFTVDEDDTETTYSSDRYYVITESIPGRLVLKKTAQQPINTDRSYGGYVVQYKAGYGSTADSVPQNFKTGLQIWAAAAYENRKLDPKNMPPDAKVMFDLFRRSKVMFR